MRRRQAAGPRWAKPGPADRQGEPPMLPPTPIRRLLLVPLVVVIAGALAALTPAVALLTVAFNLIRRRTHLGRAPRSRLLRVTWLGLVWSAGETAALAVTFCLWLA